MNVKKIAYVLFLLLTVAETAKGQQVTISNNLLYDATLTPNLRVGLRLSPHWSTGLTAGYRPWPTSDETSKKWRHLLVSPDLRYWTDSVNVHHFFGINAVYSHYNVAEVKFPFGLWKGVRDERREGDLGAVGGYYGYSWPLGRHWNVEAFIGAALGYTSFKRYKCGHCGTKIGRKSQFFILPQAGVSIVYNIPGRQRQLAEVEPVIPQIIAVPRDVVDTVEQVSVPVVPVESQVVVPVTPTPTETKKPVCVAEELSKKYPVLAHVSDYQPYDQTRVMRKDSNALYVYFVVAKYKVENSFRGNSEVLDRIVDITRQIVADDNSCIKKIQIVGLASVEGGLWGNQRLAQRRANALQKYVQERVALPDSLFETVGAGEAWADFRDQLQDMIDGKIAPSNAAKVYGVPTKKELQQAINIIDREKDLTRREQRLRSMNGGRTWINIRHVLKDQRNSGYVRIYYDCKQ